MGGIECSSIIRRCHSPARISHFCVCLFGRKQIPEDGCRIETDGNAAASNTSPYTALKMGDINASVSFGISVCTAFKGTL